MEGQISGLSRRNQDGWQLYSHNHSVHFSITREQLTNPVGYTIVIARQVASDLWHCINILGLWPRIWLAYCHKFLAQIYNYGTIIFVANYYIIIRCTLSFRFYLINRDYLYTANFSATTYKIILSHCSARHQLSTT